MRYALLFIGIMMFLIWDGMYNGGRYLDVGVRQLVALRAWVGI